MSVESRNAKELDDYIASSPECKLNRSEPYEIRGNREELEVYRFPLSYLAYNIRNGRFASELRELESDLGKFLDPENPDDARRIEELLLKDKNQAKFMTKDMMRVGQLRPGAITWDGRIIDGNRRVAVLRRLHDETSEERFNYFEAVRLPPNMSAKDLWRIEAGIQLSYDLKATYGPINELLKIREGLDAEMLLCGATSDAFQPNSSSFSTNSRPTSSDIPAVLLNISSPPPSSLQGFPALKG